MKGRSETSVKDPSTSSDSKMNVFLEENPQFGGEKVKRIIAQKKITDEDMQEKYANIFVTPHMIDTIVRDDADVFTEDGRLLIRFRKNALNRHHVHDFYDNVIDFAQNTSRNRGNTTGSSSRNVYKNPVVMSNIIGYFDRFAPIHKYSFKRKGHTPLEVRPCRFNMDYPDKYRKLIPMIQDVDILYKKYTPQHYAKQHQKARQTHFKIPGTSFTTITTNVNFQTSIHKDKGDDQEGFGNLVVIEDGKYKGGETCLPQFGLGVDVRTGDVLFMDVHQWHGNLPMKMMDKEAKRLSVVCYLRYKLWLRTKNKTRRFYEKHNHTFRRLTKGKEP